MTSLVELISKKEVKESFLIMGPTKALREDGYIAIFFKKNGKKNKRSYD